MHLALLVRVGYANWLFLLAQLLYHLPSIILQRRQQDQSTVHGMHGLQVTTQSAKSVVELCACQGFLEMEDQPLGEGQTGAVCQGPENEIKADGASWGKFMSDGWEPWQAEKGGRGKKRKTTVLVI